MLPSRSGGHHKWCAHTDALGFHRPQQYRHMCLPGYLLLVVSVTVPLWGAVQRTVPSITGSVLVWSNAKFPVAQQIDLSGFKSA
jgi:hypothetical protein